MDAFRITSEMAHNQKLARLTVRHIVLRALRYENSNAADPCAIYFRVMDVTWWRHVSGH